jgi:hypothetical protein
MLLYDPMAHASTNSTMSGYMVNYYAKELDGCNILSEIQGCSTSVQRL